MKSICVYCGSNPGLDAAFTEAARHTGETLARAGVRIVFGGGKVGLMGEVADAALAAGGRVTGVIPEFLALKEVAHEALTELFVVQSMHARKAKMAHLSGGFIALPGGIGTMEELFEIWTWGQLGQHRKPVGLLNVAGYYDDLVAFLDKMAAQDFLAADHRASLLVADNIEDLLTAFQAYQAPPADVRLKITQT